MMITDFFFRQSLNRPSGLKRLLAFIFAAGHSLYGFATENGSVFALNEVADGVYLHQGAHEDLTPKNLGDIANIGFIVGDESVMVIDPGGSRVVGERLKAAIRSVTDLPVSHVVYTHAHPDHIYGAVAFTESEHFVAHRNYELAFIQRDQFYRQRLNFLFDTGKDPETPEPQPAVTLVVEDYLELDLGNRVVRLVAHATGHTDNDLSIADRQTGVLWASDLVFSRRTPALDGSLVGWLGVLDELKEVSARLVIPGHGSPGTWDDIVEPQRRYLAELLSEVRNYIEQGARLSDAVSEIMTENTTGWALYALHHPGNITRAYTELEWE